MKSIHRPILQDIKYIKKIQYNIFLKTKVNHQNRS